jgi:hypothetical protein
MPQGLYPLHILALDTYIPYYLSIKVLLLIGEHLRSSAKAYHRSQAV